jgi:predicted acylesterase/phospholipase RssA/CRP-like cAMP-binding protein
LDVAGALARSELLPGAGKRAFASIAPKVEVRRLQPGEVLVHDGDEAAEVFVVIRGELEVVLDRDGSSQQVATMGSGSVVGEIGVLSGDRRSATLRANGATSVAVLPRDVFRELLAENPDASEELAARALARLRRTQLVAHFNERFGVFDPEALAMVEAVAQWVELRAGETLFEQGDPGDAAFLVATGRLRVVQSQRGGPQEEVGEIGRSEIVGELSLVDGAPRSASVHAVRDSHLIRFSREAYEELVERYPRVGIEITKMALRRARQSAEERGGTSIRRSFAVVPISPSVDEAEFAAELGRVLGGTARVVDSATIDDDLGRAGIAQVDDDDVGAMRLTYHLEELEGRHDHLVYRLDPTWTPWSQRAVRWVDHVVLVAGAGSDPDITNHERELWTALTRGHHAHVSLVLLHQPDTVLPSGTARWLESRNLASHHHVRRGHEGDLGRMGRLLAGTGTSLVLGGGGARGFAHLGVRQVLEDLGQPIDMVCGASIGAIMAVGPAIGWDAADARERALSSFTKLFDVTMPTTSILRGAKITRRFRAMLGDVDIVDLWVPFFCVSTNLTTAGLEVHDSGPLVDALRASIAIPGVLPPVPHGGDLLVDGGLLDNVPVAEMRRRNPNGKVLAIDVAPTDGPAAARDYGLSLSGWRAYLDRRRGDGPPALISTMVRATLLSSVHNRQSVVDEGLADLYVDVGVEGGGLLDFSTGAAIADAAAASTRGVLERWVQGEIDEEEHHVQTEPVAPKPEAPSGGGARGVALLTLRDLQHRAARVASVVIGTAVVLTLLFLISGLVEQFHREPRDTIANLGAERWMVPEGASGAFTTAAISPAAVADQVEGAEASPVVIGRDTVTVDGETRDVVVIGYEPGGIGEPEVDGALPGSGGELVIDDSSGATVGEDVTLGGEERTVSGLSDRATMFAGMPIVFMPLESAQELFYRGQPLAAAVLLDGEPSALPDGYHTLENEDIAVDAMRPLERSISSVNIVRILLWFVAAMIIGTMTYLAALERLRDMAVLKAIGASTRQLATSIAVEGAAIALLSALIAAGLQVVAVPVFPLEVSVPARALWQVPLIAVIVALVAGVAGLRKAVRVDPALAFAGPGA